jgi:hypothetical protein
VSSLVLDAGAFIAVDRDDRTMLARLRAAQRHGVELRTNANVVGQVWRDPSVRQVNLARLLRAVDVRPIDEQAGRNAGELLGRAGMHDVIDATLLLVARAGDRIVTGDPEDIRQLASVAQLRVAIVAC